MTFLIGTPHSKNAGYLLNDKALKTKREAHIQTCPHCQAVIDLQKWTDNGAWCAKCAKPICSNPACIRETALYGCVPFLKKIERHIEAQVKFDQHLKIAGLDAPAPPRSLITGLP